jgi:uncharacterized protein
MLTPSTHSVICTFWGRGVLPNVAEAVKWLNKAAEQGDADAQHELGLIYDTGLGLPQVPQDKIAASKWYAVAIKGYREAAEQGKADAEYNLGIMYNGGNGVPKNHAEFRREVQHLGP